MSVRASVLITVVGFVAAACLDIQRGVVGVQAPATPEFAHVQDLDGMPDLIVDTARLAHSWVIYDQDLDKRDHCGAVEGGVTPGVHRVLRFTVTTPNIGDADVFVGNPLDHVLARDGLFEFAFCHFHFHFRHYALYELVKPKTETSSEQVWRAAKRGFCMIDDTPWQFDGGVGSWTYRTCGGFSIPGFQGISAGWADTYNKHLSGQYLVLDGGDGQDPVPPGDYILRITVNPGFTPATGERCRYADPNHLGLCHQLAESNYDNNVAEVQVTIPDHTGKTGFGPGSENPPDTDLVDDESRPDAP